MTGARETSAAEPAAPLEPMTIGRERQTKPSLAQMGHLLRRVKTCRTAWHGHLVQIADSARWAGVSVTAASVRILPGSACAALSGP